MAGVLGGDVFRPRITGDRSEPQSRGGIAALRHPRRHHDVGRARPLAPWHVVGEPHRPREIQNSDGAFQFKLPSARGYFLVSYTLSKNRTISPMSSGAGLI